MVNLYVFSPTRKLRFLSALLHRASRRIPTRKTTGSRSQPTGRLNQIVAKIQDVHTEQSRPKFNLKVFDLVDTNLRQSRQGGLFRDVDYYKDEQEAGLCVFLVENTLFKVHKCYLLREPCVFGDMFCLPFVKGSGENQSDEPARAIPLSDTVEQFRDLLWALYAVPAQLCAVPDGDAPSLERLLNVAQMANKYCIASYETWALERILSLAQNPNGFLRQAPPETCAQALSIAILCNHRDLVDIITQKLVARMLWSDMNRQPILQVATRFGLTTLQGVVHYRELVVLERSHPDHQKHPGLAFLSGIPQEEQRLRLFSAYHSILSLWDRIRLTPPSFVAEDHTCSTHSECITTWSKMWVTAASSEQTSKHGVVDILGRLKSVMIQVKKAMMMESGTGMSLGCTLSALESITSVRDDIVAGLIGHFQR